MTINSSSFFCSWSGGKDSCLALYRAIREGGSPHFLFTMFSEGGERSRSHALHISLIGKQAQALGLPVITRSATWDDYEREFISALYGLKAEGIEAGVFGDIDIDQHRQWVERVCCYAGIKPFHPLWKEKRRELLDEFVNEGFKAVIIAVKDGVLDKRFLGKILDEDIIREIEKAGVDASGEEGEFHTVVIDGPTFSFPVNIQLKEQYFHDGYWFQDVSL